MKITKNNVKDSKQMDTEYYNIAISKSGQITLPKALQRLLEVTNGNHILLKHSGDTITITTRKKEFLESMAKVDAIRKEAERKNPKILQMKKKYAGMSFEEIRDAYDATPEGRKEFKDRYGVDIKV